jgi:heat shock protein HslJ
MRRIVILTAVLVVLASTSACSAGSGGEEIDITGNWELLNGSVDGEAIPLLDTSPVTLNVTDDEIGGTSACNSYGARMVLDGAEISLSDLVSTLMMCTPEVMAVEIPYTAALAQVNAVTFDGDTLVMTGPGVELRFARAG